MSIEQKLRAKLDLGNALLRAGSKAQPAANPAPIDFTHLGGKRIGASQPAGGKPVDISHLYGEHGGKLIATSHTAEPSDEE